MAFNPTCDFDVACSLGNAVFNHTGVGCVSSDVVQKGNHFQSDAFSVELIAGVGHVRQVLPSIAVGCPAHRGLREPAGCFALHHVPAAAAFHVDPGGAEGFGREKGKCPGTGHETPTCTCWSVPGISGLLAAQHCSTAGSHTEHRGLYRLGYRG